MLFLIVNQQKDNMGVMHEIRFSRASEINIFVNIIPTYASDIVDKSIVISNIKDRTKKYIKSVDMGGSVILSQLISTVLEDSAINDVSIKIGKSSDSLSSYNIKLLDEEVATIIDDNITVV